MILEIKNRAALHSFFERAREAGQGCHSVQGPPPHGATYDDGSPILNWVNVAWENPAAGEVIEIEYEEN